MDVLDEMPVHYNALIDGVYQVAAVQCKKNTRATIFVSRVTCPVCRNTAEWKNDIIELEIAFDGDEQEFLTHKRQQNIRQRAQK